MDARTCTDCEKPMPRLALGPVCTECLSAEWRATNERMAAMYRAGSTSDQVGEAFGLSAPVVRNRLRIAGVTIRTKGHRGAAQKVRREDHIPTGYIYESRGATFGLETDRAHRAMCERGSQALARALWRYGAKYGTLPFTAAQCAQLLDQVA